MTSPVAAPQQPIMSPPHHPMSAPPGQGYGSPTPPYGGGGWSQPAPAPKKGRTGLVVGAVVLALVLLVGGIIGIVALTGGDDDEPSADPTSSDTTDGGSEDPTEDPTSDVPDLGGPTIDGLGYTVQVPSGWTDGTTEFVEQNPGLTTLDKVFLWGTTFNTARGNVIVETQSAFGNTDPNALKDDWKEALVSSDPSADISDIANTSIGGQTALGVEIARTNDNDVDVQQRSYLVISGDKGYSITVSLKQGDDDVLSKFEEILTTWQWVS
jgi:hypothetical protein